MSKRLKINKKTVCLLFLVLAITGLRLFTMLYVSSNFPLNLKTPDSAGYIDSARSILLTEKFNLSPDAPDSPETLRTPGYPLFIAFVFSLFGIHLEPVIVFQILISVMTIVLTYLLTYQLTGSPAIGFSSSVLLVLDLPTFLHTQLIVTETVFTAFVVLIGMIGAYWIKSINSKWSYLYAFILGCTLAVSTLIRPIAYYLVFCIVAAMVIYGIISRRSFRQVAGATLVLIIPWILIVAGWQVRNYNLTGCSEVSEIQGINILYYRAAGVIALKDKISLPQAQEQLQKEYAVELLSKKDSCGPEMRVGLQVIRNNPGLYVIEQLNGLSNFLLDSNGGDLILYLNGYYPNSPLQDIGKLSPKALIDKWFVKAPVSLALFLYAKAYLIGIYPFVFVFLISLFRRIKNGNERIKDIPILFILGLTAYFVAISIGPEAYARFRVPIMPFLCIMAGAGYDEFLKFLSMRRRRTPEIS